MKQTLKHTDFNIIFFVNTPVDMLSLFTIAMRAFKFNYQQFTTGGSPARGTIKEVNCRQVNFIYK